MWLLLTALLAPPAQAGSPEPGSVTVSEAEVVRLTGEIERLGARGAWAGVERAYEQLEGAPWPTPAYVHVTGAKAARTRGDITNVRTRLQRARDREDLEEVRDWLHLIDTVYAPVSLLGDPGRATLSIEALPFDPEQAMAIRFAQSEVEEHGSFVGLLPAGTYTFQEQTVTVRPGIASQRIDVRSDRTIRRQERLERRDERD